MDRSGGWTGASGKRILVTGGTGGIGLAAATELARRGAKLSIVARSPARAEAAVRQIQAAAGGEPVDVLNADLASQASIRTLAAEVLERYPRLDVLVNNAGAIYSRRELTPEGFELTWALNHLAPFLLTNLLLDRLKESAPARIVTTSSAAHQGATRLPFDDLNAERGYGQMGFKRYSESKLANIVFTRELAKRLEGTGVSAFSFHPGFVATGFNRNTGSLMNVVMTIIRPLSRSPEKGADSLVWLVDSPDVGGPSGAYFFDRKPIDPTAPGRDADAAAKLWEVSRKQTGS